MLQQPSGRAPARSSNDNRTGTDSDAGRFEETEYLLHMAYV